MAKILSTFGRARLARVLDPLGRTLVNAGISPNTVTIAGTAVVVAASAGLVTTGHLLIALVVVTLAVCTDLVDGAMARAKGVTNRFGAFLDSTMDRIADGAIFGSLTWWLAVDGRPRAAGAAVVCLVAGQVVSYAKARAEGLGSDCPVGVAERLERLVLVGVGGLLGVLWTPYALEAALWLLAVLSIVTVVQRVMHVHRRLTAEAVPEDR